MPLEPGHLRVVRTFTGRSDTSIWITSKWALHTGAWLPSLERRLLLPLPSLGPLLGDHLLSSHVTYAHVCFISASLACLSAGLEKQG